eukprot:CAMPEP_0185767594 /NCGR_PEP_ID=MMETSP1174-20130828/45026_1 /TAXON_ID=35687 /ORGANISM="Dictyocha speculum, Strain CCMP1381" /LENGTH=220 /DNA_ID=CAMNT_0028451879 /DNA_START=32 /DNA_END=694 /DNA_ORIENTATION=-
MTNSGTDEEATQIPTTQSRRVLFSRTAAAGAAAMSTISAVGPASAIGPVNMEIMDYTYEAAECPKNFGGRVGGSFTATAGKAVLQQCVKISCTLTNPTKKPLVDVAVFGFVSEERTGASAIANNPDFRSDAGQFATIDSVPPGTNKVDFVFVASLNKDDSKLSSAEGLPKLVFRSLKAISYPGGARFQELSACELDSLSDECDDVSDEDRDALKEKKMRY